MPERKPNPPADLTEYADVGDAVNWFAGGDPTLTPLVGIVIQKSPGGGANTANLTVATFTGSGFAVQEGVMHMTNPLARRKGKAGGWQHRPLDLLFRRYLFALGAMKWDGDESYGANPAFDYEGLGVALTALGASRPTKPQTGKPEGGDGKKDGEGKKGGGETG